MSIKFTLRLRTFCFNLQYEKENQRKHATTSAMIVPVILCIYGWTRSSWFGKSL